MLIIVTDSGLIWNHENPYLEQYAESVLVVCLSGKRVTDKYRCFVSPYRFHGLGGTGFGVQTAQYRALESVSEDFIRILWNHDHILFLTDNDPETLYPFNVIKSRNEFINSLHLCTFSPWRFETSFRRKTHELLLNDLSSLKSILYWDSNDALLQLSPKSTILDAISAVQKRYGELLPTRPRYSAILFYRTRLIKDDFDI